MAVPNTFTSGTKAKASEVNENFAYIGMVPIGAIIPWLKSYTNTPALDNHFVECNGQTLSDGDSVYNGQVIPDLNGDNRFLRGSTTSGTETDGIHNHQWIKSNHYNSGNRVTLVAALMSSSSTNFVDRSWDSSGNGTDLLLTSASANNLLRGNFYTDNIESVPKSYSVVWIMRVK